MRADSMSAMKYQRWYDQIIERARHRTLDVYHERHHILPRCLGGSDDPSNLVDLTYREHFLVHWLLTRLHEGRAKILMVFAVNAMTMQLGPRLVGGWRIEVAKRLFKQQALERLARRRAAWLAKRRAEYDERIRLADGVRSLQPHLTPASPKDRARIAEAARHLLRAHPKTLGKIAQGGMAKKVRPRRRSRADTQVAP